MFDRLDEEAFVAQRDDKSSGNEWERVNRLIDLNFRTGKGFRDTARMKSIFIQVRRGLKLSRVV